MGLEKKPDVVLASLESWKESEDWTKEGGKYIPGAHRFLENGKWDEPPAVHEGEYIPPEEREWNRLANQYMDSLNDHKGGSGL